MRADGVVRPANLSVTLFANRLTLELKLKGDVLRVADDGVRLAAEDGEREVRVLILAPRKPLRDLDVTRDVVEPASLGSRSRLTS